jgi:hypothetical protein
LRKNWHLIRENNQEFLHCNLEKCWIDFSASILTYNKLGTGLWLFRALSRLAFFPLIRVTPLKDSCFRPSIFEWILAFLVSNVRFDNPEWAFQLPVDYIFSFICLKSKNPDVMTWFGHFGQKFSVFSKKISFSRYVFSTFQTILSHLGPIPGDFFLKNFSANFFFKFCLSPKWRLRMFMPFFLWNWMQ